MDALSLNNDIAVVDEGDCIDCGSCVDACPVEAIAL
jgi:NAD-dependent dihydropyrimidine dehydrogenase PreA subunit